MKSIIQDNRECYICRNPFTEEHHVYYGTANRKLSEKYGLKVWLCPYHHRGIGGVHFNKELDNRIKEVAREKFEAVYPYNFQRLFYGDGIEVLNEQYRQSRFNTDAV